MADRQFLSIKTIPDHITLDDVRQLEAYGSEQALFTAMLLRVLIEIRDGPPEKSKRKLFGGS